jgi:pyruvate formate lyase activating enzyme
VSYHELKEYAYLEDDLSKCKLCEWECGVDRLDGEVGACSLTIPEVSSSQLHPAPPASFDAFMAGCNFRCLFCQNWMISTYPVNPASKKHGGEGYYEPRSWADLGLSNLRSVNAKHINADRLFFTGGEPTCSLPWVEAVVEYAREIDSSLKVNFDTNGYMTKKSLGRVLDMTTSITYDIKAYNEKIFQALTGTVVEPVLRNAEYIGKHAKDKLWEFRIMGIPGVHEQDVDGLTGFIAGIDPGLPVNFLAFRPNFVMEEHPGADRKLMELCIETAEKNGLENVTWSGQIGIEGEVPVAVKRKMKSTDAEGLVSAYANEYRCISFQKRICKNCMNVNECKIKDYITTKIL